MPADPAGPIDRGPSLAAPGRPIHRGPRPEAPGPPRLTRRRLLQLGLALPLPMVLAACQDAPGGDPADQAAAPTTAAPPASSADGSAPGATLAPTPACDDGDEPTVAQTEGPYFTPDSPERASLLEAGMGGQRLVVAGTVLTTDCRPVRRALLDFWQADDAGQYDNQGYRLRGHQFSDDRGAWRLETVVPGIYSGRTRHLHVKVQAPDGPVLTTQLYFPGEPANERDGIFSPELLLGDVRDRGDRRTASFTFVLAG
jgi:protocatechuate 3,4-dioxygenase beta subunit